MIQKNHKFWVDEAEPTTMNTETGSQGRKGEEGWPGNSNEGIPKGMHGTTRDAGY